MKRRSFLKNSLASGTAITVGSCTPTEKEKQAKTTQQDDFPLSEKSIAEISDAYKTGNLSCQKVKL